MYILLFAVQHNALYDSKKKELLLIAVAVDNLVVVMPVVIPPPCLRKCGSWGGRIILSDA